MGNKQKWYHRSGPQGDIVISTRVRLARNLREFPFSERLDANDRRQVCDKIRKALAECEDAVGKFDYLPMEKVSSMAARSLLERHLISPEFMENSEGRGVLLSRDESISIMLCEEDHVRIQVMAAGFDADRSYELADRLDTVLDEKLHFAFDERLGYLTQCPTNLGTGMRASLMLHLPALEMTGGMPDLARAISKIGLTIRGTFGEGTKASGAMYQLSNQITLGISESTALSNLSSIARQVITREQQVRDSLNTDLVEDRVFRALGTAQNARILGKDEFMELMSAIRLGISIKRFPTIGFETINTLVADMQPASLVMMDEQAADPAVRDRLRARLVREKLCTDGLE